MLRAHVDNPLPVVERRYVGQHLPGKEAYLLGFCDIFILNHLKTIKPMNFKEFLKWCLGVFITVKTMQAYGKYVAKNKNPNKSSSEKRNSPILPPSQDTLSSHSGLFPFSHPTPLNHTKDTCIRFRLGAWG